MFFCFNPLRPRGIPTLGYVKIARNSIFGAITLICLLLAPGIAPAQSLKEAWVSAYGHAQELRQARADFQVSAEGVVQAEAQLLPTITVSASAGQRDIRTGLTAGGTRTSVTSPVAISLTLVQPIFEGQRRLRSLDQARAVQRAQLQTYRNIEQTVMFNAVQAYLGVLSARRLLALQQQEVQFLQDMVRNVRDRQSAGESSRADVAQTQSRLAAARAGLTAAQGALRAADVTFRQRIGQTPGRLSSVRLPASLPGSLNAAIAIAAQGHPANQAAVHNLTAVQNAFAAEQGRLSPSVNLTGTVSRQWGTVGTTVTNDAQVGLEISVPLFRGGSLRSQVREAGANVESARAQLDLVAEQVAGNVEIAWSDVQWTRETITLAQAQVNAQQMAFDGIRSEERVGLRGTLDVLNAFSELTFAKSTLVSANADAALAGFALLGATGQLDARSLGLSVAYFEPPLAGDG